MKTKISQVLSYKTAAVLFAFVLSLFSICLWNMSEMSVYASESEFTAWDDTTYEDYAVATYNGATAKTYIGSKAPSVDDYVFAGWFTNSKCTVEQAISSSSSVANEDICYAKFVPEGVLSTKVQVSNGDVNLDTNEEERNMRFVSSVDNLVYQSIGFRMKYKDANGDWIYKINTGKIVFERIVSATAGDEYKFSPKVVDTKSEYFMTATWKGEDNTGLEKSDFDTDYYVRAYWVTLDGVRVYGPTRYVSVDDGLNANIVNVSVEDKAGKWAKVDEKTGLKASFIGSDGVAKSDVPVKLALHDGTYAHLKINLGDGVNRKTALSSATMITVSDGTNEKYSIYRNLYTTHVKTDSSDVNADITWYQTYFDQNNAEDEFVIATSADLYGMEYLANYNGGGTLETFSGEKIYVVADITVNEGIASVENGWTPKVSGSTVYPWYAIRGFAGQFDGQGHMISGLYGTMDDDTTSNHYAKGYGLFTETANATICNLNLVNSFYPKSDSNGAGALVGRGSGTFRQIYSDVVIGTSATPASGYMGGILGVTTDSVTVTDCWSNSELNANGAYSGGIVGNANGKKVMVEHCLNSGNYSYTGSGNPYAGGIVGRGDVANTVLTIKDCLNVGIIASTKASTRWGSILGTSLATADITNCYSIYNYKVDGTTYLPEVGVDNREEQTGTASLELQDLSDMNAFCNTALSFNGYDDDGYWAIRDDATPMLVSFLDEEDNVIGLTGRSKTDFVIVDGVGYISVLSQLEDFRDKINGKDETVTFAEGEVALMTDDIVINEGSVSGWVDDSETLPATDWTSINGFSGIFDGQGYTISGLYDKDTENSIAGIGLFTNVIDATIRNLNIVDSYLAPTSNSGTGALVGVGYGTFENIHVNVTIHDDNGKGYIGGIIGKVNGDSTLRNCWNETDITSAGQYCAGLVARYDSEAVNITMEHCHNTGNMTYTGEGSYPYLAGMISRVRPDSATTGVLEITDCLNEGKISRTTTSSVTTSYMGGLVATGRNGEATTYAHLTKITNSYHVMQADGTGETTLVSAYASNKYITTTNSDVVESVNVTGINSYYYSNLDLYSSSNSDAYWAARAEETPILVSFYDGEKLDISNMTETTLTLTNNKGYIANADQLLDFATQVDAGDTDSDTVVKLVNDIELNSGWEASAEAPSKTWTSIEGYAGVFDGQGHTISGIYGVKKTIGVGLFSNTTETTIIQNLNVTNSYFAPVDVNGTGVISGYGSGTFKNIYTEALLVDEGSATKYGNIGGVIGKIEGSAMIENCWSNSDIKSTYIYLGGMVGNGNGKTVSISHCLNTGDIILSKEEAATNAYIGGIIGKAGGGSGSKTSPYIGDVEIEDCLNLGTVYWNNSTQRSVGGIAAYGTGNDVYGEATLTIANCASVLTYDENDALPGATAIVGWNATLPTLSNNSMLDYDELLGIKGFNNTDLDFGTEDASGYWTAREGATPMLTEFLSSEDIAIDVSDLIADKFVLSDNKGEISNEAQLASFRDRMNAGSLSVDNDTMVTLTKDIVINEGNATVWSQEPSMLPEKSWLPIVGFSGIFDGQGHTISGLYLHDHLYVVGDESTPRGLGLFTETNNATIQNLSIINSYAFVETSNGTGPVIGYGSGTLKKIYTDVIIHDTCATGNKGRVGGMVGKASGTLYIENCWSDTDIYSIWQYIGGIVGYSYSKDVTINHCLNTGTLTFAGAIGADGTPVKTINFGGIVGNAYDSAQASSGVLQITDCLNAGIVSGTEAVEYDYMGGLVGLAGEAYETSKNDEVVITESVVISNSYSVIYHDENNNAISVTKLVGKDRRTNQLGGECIAYNHLLGMDAFYQTELDFENYWAVREENLPMLISFLNTADTRMDVTGYITDIATAYGTTIPEYTSTSGTVSTYNSLGDGGYEVCVSSTSSDEFEEYGTTLAETFTLASTKTVAEGNIFQLYTGKGVHIYLSWYPTLEMSRVIMTRTEALPSDTAISVGVEDTITPSIAQVKLEGLGMSYVAQLADGSFILIDGGQYERTNGYGVTDIACLYEYLVEKTPAGQTPTIACWMYSHPDPDHIELSTEFLAQYADKVEINSFAYNFAGESLVTTNNSKDDSTDTDAGIQLDIKALEQNMEIYYPEAIAYNIHAGQSYYLKGVEIEILQTEEEIYPSEVTCWNDTSASWRMKFDGGKSALFVGDSMTQLCQRLADVYGSYLKSDIFQLAHHGLVGGVLELYKYINPDICFWPTTEANCSNETYLGYDYNEYLLDTSEKERTFYNNGSTNAVSVN